MPSTHRHGPAASSLRAPVPVPPPSLHAREAHYNDVRDRYVLVEYDRRDAALSVLLRFDGAEDATTRKKLRELGFVPTASPAHASMSFKKHVSEQELSAACTRLSETLGDAAVLDLGGSFADHVQEPLRRLTPANAWRGNFLLHVGGTRRCVVFDSSADDSELMRVAAGAREDYFANDFHPITE